MNKLLIVVALVFSATVANAQEAEKTSPTWNMVQSACGGEYKATKGTEGRKTWGEFLNECKVRKGFVAKKGGKAVVTLPDVN